MKNIESMFYVGIIAVVLVFGVGMYMEGSLSHESPSASTSSNEYNITLVITNQSYMSSVQHNQPAFFVLENGKLMSSAQIYLPGNSLIRMTILNYDSGPGTVPSQYSKVTGTLNNTEYVINDTNVNASSGQTGKWVNSIPPSELSHSFTIPNVVNILIPSQSIVVAMFHTPASGVFDWHCYVNCGYGSSGWGGAMSTPGWMEGEVVIG